MKFSRPDHEAAIIAASFASPTIIPAIAMHLRPEHFFEPTIGEVWKVILDLQSENKPINHLTVGNKVGAKSFPFLKKVHQKLSSPQEAVDAAQAVIEQWMLRTLKDKTENLTGKLEDTDDPWTLVEEIQSLLHDVSKNKAGEFVSLSEATTKMLESAKRVASGEVLAVQPFFGLPTFEGKIGGVLQEEGELIVISGRPGSGKSSLANNIIIQSVKDMSPVVMWSGEMSEKETATRFYGGFTGIPTNNIKQGRILSSDREMAQLHGAMEKLDRTLVDYAFGGMYWEDLKPMIIHYHLAKGVRTFILDRLELIGVKKYMRRDEYKPYITGQLRLLATKYNLKIVLMVQMRKEVEKSKMALPSLGDVIDSTATTNDATKVLLVYRPEIHGIVDIPGFGTTIGRGQIICAKNTYGDTEDDHWLDFRKHIQTWADGGSFVELDPDMPF